MYKKNILPIGESELHIPAEECKCNPKVVERNYDLVLVHNAFDHREIWLLAEMMMGLTCFEHMLHVDEFYIPGKFHYHQKKSDPVFEYEHEKIDPR